MPSKTFVIVDGHALIYRGYYAIPALSTKQGELVNAVFGFTSLLLNMLSNIKPDYLAVAFDLKGPTFRHEAYEEYKATRSETPDDLISQVPRIRQIVEAFQIPVFQQAGFEADDLIGTIAHKIQDHPDVNLLILSGDMDLTQLITEQVKVVTPLSGFNAVKTYDAQAVMDKYAIRPDQMVDFKAMMGDASDNIPGVAGIGKKTAAKLLFQFDTLDGIYENLGEIKGAVHDKLVTDKEMAYKSQHLATIVTDIPIELDLQSCKTHEVNSQTIRLLFEELEFKRLIYKFDSLQEDWNKENQGVLF
jgi:DNA polymerase I